MDRQTKILSYCNGNKDLDKALRDFPQEMWAYRPTPKKWSINQILVHLADSEAHAYIRLRRIIAEPEKIVIGYDQDKWADRLFYEQQDPTLSLMTFKFLRTANGELLKIIPDEVWEHYVYHDEYGKMTLYDWLDRYERHLHLHIFQMYRNLKSWEEEAN